MNPIDDLIKALTIFKKYLEEDASPTHCEHDELMVMVTKKDLDQADVAELKTLGFRWNSDIGCWSSGRFGSA